MVNICNRKGGPHSPRNVEQRQTRLLDILDWFSRWRALHDELVETVKATESNLFVVETWFCIRALILTQVAVIEIYCVQRSEEVNPFCMTTDTVENKSGDERQTVGRSHNKLSALGFDRGKQKTSAASPAKYRLVDNKKNVENFFKRY